VEQTGSIAVVIPSFRVTQHILGVLERIGPEVARIFVVDDACPDRSGALVQANCKDPRVRVLFNPVNLGVGGAVMHGYREAIAEGHTCVIKIDGDGQMDASLIPLFARPILEGTADYIKGNRFSNPEDVAQMPRVRLFGNAVLSFMTKLSSGYWSVLDPTNGFTAIHASVAARLPLEKIAPRYFFETDILFRLGTLGAVVHDIPLRAIYGDEKSNLRIGAVLPGFLAGHIRNSLKRLVYVHYLRSFSVASVELVLGLALFLFGATFGTYEWIRLYREGQVATAGTVMLAALPVIIGTQLLLSFLRVDVEAEPRLPIASVLPKTIVRPKLADASAPVPPKQADSAEQARLG
jgi:dolichol-phosphate mannosyltransferase